MKTLILLSAGIAALWATTGCAAARSTKNTASTTALRANALFDTGWRFTRGDPPGAENPSFSDQAWTAVTLPHDWSIGGPFDEKNPAGGAGAFLPTGVAWYRKSFTLPESDAIRHVCVQFDGVMQNSDVWINGHLLGHRPYGYVSFVYELTSFLQFGSNARNVLAVRADTSQQPASRWYAGSGIYRHVHLITTDAVHTEPWATFVATRSVTGLPQPTAAVLSVQTRVVNQSASPRQAAVRFTIYDAANHAVATTTSAPAAIAPATTAGFSADLPIDRPRLWDISSPYLYRATAEVIAGTEPVDLDSVSFGIRTAVFDSARGFLLNGRPLKLLGVCLHEDGGAFGAAVPLAVWEQRLTTLRTLGVNAIRTAHNPPDPGFLDLCDRMGFLVMDELFDCWTVGKNKYDYHLYFKEWSQTDVRDTVRRDRNHPSIVLYSAGNEIHDTPKAELAKSILSGLIQVFHENDPTRPVTQALFRPNASHDYTDGLADMLDVIGTNYRDSELLAAWQAKPGRKIIGTEQRHDRETWLALRDHPAEAGQFLWTGVDYLGESRRWPVIGSGSGLLDRTAWVKPGGSERQSWWSAQPMVAITRRIAPTARSNFDPGYEPAAMMFRWRQVLFPDWTPANLQPHAETVEVYSNCETVELFLNGRSLGAKTLNQDASPRLWEVTYAPGTLRAVGRNGGKVVANCELRTAGAPARIVLTATARRASPDWEDVVRVDARVVDAAGTPVPAATNEITFTTGGPGTVVAVDNGDLSSHEPFQATRRHAYQGRCAAWVRATDFHGTIVVKVSADGLSPAQLEIAAVR